MPSFCSKQGNENAHKAGFLAANRSDEKDAFVGVDPEFLGRFLVLNEPGN